MLLRTGLLSTIVVMLGALAVAVYGAMLALQIDNAASRASFGLGVGHRRFIGGMMVLMGTPVAIVCLVGLVRG